MHLGLGMYLAGAAVVGRPYTEASSLYYAGGGERLAVPHDAAFQFGLGDAWTLIADVKAETAGNALLFNKYDTGTGLGMYVQMAAANNMFVTVTAAAGGSISGTGTTAPATGVWVRIAITVDGSDTSAGILGYHDGAVDTFTPGVSNLVGSPENTEDLVIGARVDGADPLTGNGGVFALYNYAMTPAQVLAIGPASNPYDHRGRPGLVGCWRPDDLTGTTVPDSSSNSNDATMAGGMVAANLARDIGSVVTEASIFGTACVAWWEAGKRVTLGAGLDASAWGDQTGKLHEATQAVVGNQPTPGTDGAGLEYLDFVRADTNYMAVANVAETSNSYYLVAVIDPTTNPNGGIPFDSFGGARVALYSSVGASPLVGMFDGANRTADAATLPFQSLAWEIDNSTPRFRAYRNGTAIGNSAVTAGRTITGATQIGAASGPANAFDGKLYNMFLLNRLPTAPELAAWATLRAEKYGL